MPSEEGLLDCLCKQALERNGLPLARGVKLDETWWVGNNRDIFLVIFLILLGLSFLRIRNPAGHLGAPTLR
jgi:hypothetical protein